MISSVDGLSHLNLGHGCREVPHKVLSHAVLFPWITMTEASKPESHQTYKSILTEWVNNLVKMLLFSGGIESYKIGRKDRRVYKLHLETRGKVNGKVQQKRKISLWKATAHLGKKCLTPWTWCLTIYCRTLALKLQISPGKPFFFFFFFFVLVW